MSEFAPEREMQCLAFQITLDPFLLLLPTPSQTWLVVVGLSPPADCPSLQHKKGFWAQDSSLKICESHSSFRDRFHWNLSSCSPVRGQGLNNLGKDEASHSGTDGENLGSPNCCSPAAPGNKKTSLYKAVSQAFPTHTHSRMFLLFNLIYRVLSQHIWALIQNQN